MTYNLIFFATTPKIPYQMKKGLHTKIALKLTLLFFLTTGLLLNLQAQSGAGHTLTFNGTSSYATAPSINLNGAQITFMTWVNISQFKSASPYISSIMGTEDISTSPASTALLRAGDATILPNQLQFVLGLSTNGGLSVTFSKLTSNASLLANTWYHIAGTYDGTTMKLYINGQLDNSLITTGTVACNSVFSLGRNYGNDRILNGKIDESSIWGTALSQATIRDWMCRKITSSHPNYTDLKAYWSYDNATGTTVTDKSGNGYHATFVSTPTWGYSSAPIGDLSTHVYGGPYQLSLSHPSMGDSASLTLTSGAPSFIHMYMVDSVPNTITPPSGTQRVDTGKYWGVFVGGSANYLFKYYYDLNQDITQNEKCNLSLAARSNNATLSWSNLTGTTTNFSNQNLVVATSNSREIITTVKSGNTHHFTFDKTEPSCYGDNNGAIVAHASGGTAPYTYMWNTAYQDSSAAGLAAGWYYFTVTDINTCESNDSVFIDQPDTISIVSAVTNVTCDNSTNGAISLTTTGGTGTYTYTWNPSSLPNTASITNLTVGSYTVTVTDVNNCTNDISVSVSFINANPTPSLGNDTTVCPGTSLSYNPTQNGIPYASYLWSDGSSFSYLLPSTPGTYGVTVTTLAGCQGNTSVTISNFAVTSVFAGNDTVLPNPPFSIAATSGYAQYVWSNGDNGNPISVSTTGVYTVTATDANGCTSTDNINVSFWPASVTELTQSNTVTFYPNPAASNTVVTASSLQPIATIEIFDVQGRMVLKQLNFMNSNSISFQLPALTTGTYMLKIVCTDNTSNTQKLIINN